MNICIVKCYKEVYCKEGIINNIGSYIILIIILCTIILLIVFTLKRYKIFIKKIKKYFNQINSQKNNNNKNNNNNNINKKKLLNNLNIKNKTKEFKNIKKVNSKNNNILFKKNKTKINPPIKVNNKHKVNNKSNNKNKNNKIEYNINNFNSISKLKGTKPIINIQNNINYQLSIYNVKKNKKKFNNKSIDKIKSINITINDYELNNLSYKVALKKDKRKYIQYYCSLLKMKHIIIFTFFNNTDYNSKIIKICLFLFSFSLYYTVNALFFTDSTIHKIYKNKDLSNFIYQIPSIIYSMLISLTINSIIRFFSLTERDI